MLLLSCRPRHGRRREHYCCEYYDGRWDMRSSRCWHRAAVAARPLPERVERARQHRGHRGAGWGGGLAWTWAGGGNSAENRPLHPPHLFSPVRCDRFRSRRVRFGPFAATASPVSPFLCQPFRPFRPFGGNRFARFALLVVTVSPVSPQPCMKRSVYPLAGIFERGDAEPSRRFAAPALHLANGGCSFVKAAAAVLLIIVIVMMMMMMIYLLD